MSRNIKSSVVIAKLLASEGFSDHVQNLVEKYWLRSICWPGRRKSYRRLDRSLAELAAKLTEAEKMILGKFISLHKTMSFDTGMRIGLMAFATKRDREWELHKQQSEETLLKQESTLPPGEEATPTQDAPRRSAQEKRKLAGIALRNFDSLAAFLGKPSREIIEYTNLVQMVRDRREYIAEIKRLHAKIARLQAGSGDAGEPSNHE